MPEPLRPKPVAPVQSAGSDRLDSWKDIAAYFGREVRTVQGWEKNEGLPIHRHQHARQGSVYAFKSELEAWRKQRASSPEGAAVLSVDAPPSAPRSWRMALIVAAGLAVIAAGFFAIRSLRPKSSGDAISSVVVLPFVDMSPAKDQEYFSDGLTEEIIDALSRVPNLHVVARTSAFQFKGKAADIRQIGRQLDVSSVLEGSVRKSGDQLRITAQLNRVSDGFHLWSRTYDRPLRDVFAVQREISQAIAGQLGAGQVRHREPTADMQAYRFYQEGRYFFNQFNPNTYEKAVERFRQAVERDPKFALAYSGLADALAYRAESLGAPPKEIMPQARQAAEKAIALDPTLGEGHTSLGIVLQDYEWDISAAEREFRRAIELIPGSAYASHWLGHTFEAQGRLDDAMRQMRASLALDPLSAPIYTDLALELIGGKKYDDALALLQKGRELFPDSPTILFTEASANLEKGDTAHAREYFAALKQLMQGKEDEAMMISGEGYLAAKEGRPADARAALAHLEQLRTKQYVDVVSFLDICGALQDRTCVNTWLQRGLEDRSVLFPYIRIYTPHAFLGNPQAEALVRKALKQ